MCFPCEGPYPAEALNVFFFPYIIIMHLKPANETPRCEKSRIQPLMMSQRALMYHFQVGDNKLGECVGETAHCI